MKVKEMLSRLIKLIASVLLVSVPHICLSENILAYKCYDDMLMTTQITDETNPNGSVLTTERWTIQNALVVVDMTKRTLLLWQTSRSFSDIINSNEKAHWTFYDIMISDDLVTAHSRSKSEKYHDEFDLVTLDLFRPKLIKTVSMNNDKSRWTKHYDCKKAF